MSASRSSPTINLLDLPLSAVTVSMHYLPGCLHSIVTSVATVLRRKSPEFTLEKTQTF